MVKICSMQQLKKLEKILTEQEVHGMQREGMYNSDGRPVIGRYADVLSDSGFKAVFGDVRNKEVLRVMLNEMLPLERKIDRMSLSTVEIPGMTPTGKSIRLDLHCIADDGAEFIIEMQRYNQDNFFKRCMCYASKVYSGHLEKMPKEQKRMIQDSRKIEDMEYDLKPIYLIGLMAVDLPHEKPELWDDKYISYYTMMEKSTGEIRDETISIIFVELARFGKRKEECRSKAEEWLYALKNGSSMKSAPESLDQGINSFYSACEIANFDKVKRMQYEEGIMTEYDYYSIINTAARKGLREGKEKGGQEKALEIAKKMKGLGIDMDLIVKSTGLTEEEVREL
jgi:hypothetical protein